MKIFIIICSILCFGCTQPQTSKEVQPWVMALGDTVWIPKNVQRVVSLTPSITEFLYAFTDTSKIVAVSHQCTYPKEARRKQSISSYPVDIEAIVRLRPDVVLVKSDMIDGPSVQKLKQLHVPVVLLDFNSLTAIRSSLFTMVSILEGDSLQAAQWWNTLIHPMDTLTLKKPTRYAAVVSVQPIYVYGQASYFTEVAAPLGINVMQEVNHSFPPVSVEYLVQKEPQVYFFEDSAAMHHFWELYPILASVKPKSVVVPSDIYTRPGIRLPILKSRIQQAFLSHE
ncbi:MAG: helical backbone metal receptor [Cytophagaceae bacterium]|nr:helical backbone metal receptor [Cytophagaceae bacterium]